MSLSDLCREFASAKTSTPAAIQRAGAAVIVEESNLEATHLVDTMATMLNDPIRLSSMSIAAKSLAHPKAVEEIAAMVRELAGSSDEVVGNSF
jgi:UDP-N-acetylglucosamine:LPS N-acetylglucosamine transferase